MSKTMEPRTAPTPQPALADRLLRWARARMGAIGWVLLVLAIKFVVPKDWAWPLSWIALGLIILRTARTLRRKRPLTADHFVRNLCGATILIVLALPGQWRSAMLNSGWIALPAAIVAMHVVLGSVRGSHRARAASGDFRTKAAAFLECLVPERLAKFAAADLNLLTYVIPGLRRRHEPPGHLAFGYHRQIRPILVVFISLASLEALVGHLMLIHANPVVRWVVFVISDLGLIYFIALAASLSRLPLLVARDHIVVRAGIFIEIDIPIDAMASVRRFVGTEGHRRTGSLNATLMSSPSVYLEFNREIPASIPIKGVRNVVRAGVRPDDPIAFIAAVEAAMTAHRLDGVPGTHPSAVDHAILPRPDHGWEPSSVVAAC